MTGSFKVQLINMGTRAAACKYFYNISFVSVGESEANSTLENKKHWNNNLQFRQSYDVFTTITYVFFITLSQHHLALTLLIISNTFLKLFLVRFSILIRKRWFLANFTFTFSCIERCSQLTPSNDQRSITRPKSYVSLSKFRIWKSVQCIGHVIGCCSKYSIWFKW